MTYEDLESDYDQAARDMKSITQFRRDLLEMAKSGPVLETTSLNAGERQDAVSAAIDLLDDLLARVEGEIGDRMAELGAQENLLYINDNRSY